MSALVLTLKSPPRQRVDLSPLTPSCLAAHEVAAIAGIELSSGNRRVPVGDLFEVAPGDPRQLVIRSASTRLDFIGRNLCEGSITVEGDVGAYLGLGMRGGHIEVTGGAGPWAGAAMCGGAIEIHGDAGDFLGGALPGDMRGMAGGLVAVRGRAGERAGDRMRRGTIVIGGNVGAYPGSRMIAGTLIVLGSGIGAYPGFGMRRGTVLFRHRPPHLLPTFADCGTHELGFLRLLKRSLGGIAFAAPALGELRERVRRLVGDAAADGKGEILVAHV